MSEWKKKYIPAIFSFVLISGRFKLKDLKIYSSTKKMFSACFQEILFYYFISLNMKKF